ncbi:MAG: O-antigen ligase family protein [Brevundimonas sp.]|uniref:O-antigen ligase family protein n=1 Tax=Brevundimonas sp. TaxID=1871086 RepID=UPI0017D9D2C8|nr:O-antigen ligase family protein [Brevundimonas sp.]MBA4804679.1 O-antigen ligase family protein [Brevundimonas sp.]
MSQQGTAALAAGVLLAFAFLFGGASRQHELRVALVELAALLALVLAVFAIDRPVWHQARFAVGILAAIAAIPLLQLIPMPPALWTALPGRDQLVLALDVLDMPPGWVPLSLAPDHTRFSLLALTAPVAMFLATMAAPPEYRRRLVYGLIGLTVLSIALGALQLVSGTERFYPWATTDAGSLNGFFANRNHLATLCLITIPFAAALGAAASRRQGRHQQLILWSSMMFIVLAIVALGAIRSRAGVILVWPVLAASLVAAWVASGGRPKPTFLVFIGAAGAALSAVAVFALAPILARFSGGAGEGRFENWPTVLEAANIYLPFGSGIGSFDPVFRSVEPLATLDATYFNQAHNDYLETWLETGWLGAAVLAAFLVWFGRRAWLAWRAPTSTAHDLQRAASIAIGATLLHSAADYPLRTLTIAVVFAMCCALLEQAAWPEEWTRIGKSRGSRRA